MIGAKPKKWTLTSLGIMVMYTNYHITIKTSPFQALYGVPQAQCGFEQVVTMNEKAIELLIDMGLALKILHKKLHKA